MIEFVLDTNVLSEMMRQRVDPKLETQVTRHRLACAIPAPVVDELQFGICRIASLQRRSFYQQWLELLMADFPVIPLDGACAQWLGRERAQLVAIGKTPPLYDGLIASVAVVNELTLVTRNTRDFEFFSGIQLQDWFNA